MITDHILPPQFLEGAIPVAIVGAGGNGSQFLNGLARLHLALRACGHPGGFDVVVFDPDIVTEANVGRQLFSPADIGQHKATVLVHRVNMFFGLEWRSQTEKFPVQQLNINQRAVVVGCVDTAAARREIRTAISQVVYPPVYWLDLGNESTTGQVVLGSNEWDDRRGNGKAGKQYVRLPYITDLFPEILDASRPESDLPSCSLLEALGKQDLFINQQVTTQALQLLWRLFRHGRIQNHGSFINLDAGTVRPLPIDPELWQRMGYPKPAPPEPKIPKKPVKKPARKRK